MIVRKTESETILLPEKSAPRMIDHKTMKLPSRRTNTAGLDKGFAPVGSVLDMNAKTNEIHFPVQSIHD
jgi:hypothetical protein